MFIKCLEYQYAKAFIDEGAIRFAMPSEWKPDGTSRGDNLEGVYASQRGFDPVLEGLLKALRKDVMTEKDGDLTFYKSKEVTSYRAYCMYGVNDTCVHMQTQRSQDHRYHEGGVVKKEYFRNLFPDVTPENVEKLDEKNRPAALFIKPDDFINLLTTKLMEMGVRKEEIIIGPVAYMDYFQEAFHVDRKPMELFCKDYRLKKGEAALIAPGLLLLIGGIVLIVMQFALFGGGLGGAKLQPGIYVQQGQYSGGGISQVGHTAYRLNADGTFDYSN